ncbi:prephenate dehydrogenase/arogenate dehydrogenase family protein [Candidatus Kaiserbacteria bacterium]|nr:prephenate dehydrogenase/arogenate dehydrogenase family protein [Candidatus Kaiserbacteria bacterium]
MHDTTATTPAITCRSIGIIGDGHYGRLLRKLIRRFALDVNVQVHDNSIDPDGHTYVRLRGLRKCDAVILAVPMDIFEQVVKNLLAVNGLREDMVLVNVCSDQVKSGATIAALAGKHPYISAHSPWGPDAYRDVNEIVSLLPPIVLTKCTLPHPNDEDLFFFIQNCGFKIETMMSAEAHDRNLAGRWMYCAHLITQILGRMKLLEEDCRAAPISYQKIVEGARMLRDDRALFFTLWDRVPECHATFDAFMAAAHGLAVDRREHISGK